MSTKANPLISPTRAALFSKAVRHLGRKCPVMKGLVARVGPCTWVPVSDDPFTIMVRCVIYQQISTRAAKTIFERVVAAVGGMPIAPNRLAALTEDDFRACGVSGPKQRTLRAVVAHVEANPDLFSGLEARDADLLRDQLTVIKGIGPWSVDMFLMFAISRPDILPVADLGLKAGIKRFYGFKEMPTVDEMKAIGDLWKPYRSIGTWYLWRGLELPAV